MTLPLLFLLAAVGWVPILLRFYESWRDRRNPVSLAICALIIMVVYLGALFALHLLGEITSVYVGWLLLGFDVLVCVNFYLSFAWSRARFKSDRKAN